MCACLLLDPFQQYLEMSVVLFICTASEKNCSFGNGNVLLEFFFFLVGEVLWVIVIVRLVCM